MLGPLADSGAIAWPLALALTTVAVAGRMREGRRRERLNRALHELRRPLQALALAPPPPARAGLPGQLEAAAAALAELDRELNGGCVTRRRRTVDARELAAAAVGRWRAAAAAGQRSIALRWHANGTRVHCEPAAIAGALDNLIANALEHGSGPIELEGVVRRGRLRLFVCDGSDASGDRRRGRRELVARRPAGLAGRWRTDPRRGHGLAIVADVAAEHGGRFAACRHAAGASAVLELPLASAGG